MTMTTEQESIFRQRIVLAVLPTCVQRAFTLKPDVLEESGGFEAIAAKWANQIAFEVLVEYTTATEP